MPDTGPITIEVDAIAAVGRLLSRVLHASWPERVGAGHCRCQSRSPRRRADRRRHRRGARRLQRRTPGAERAVQPVIVVDASALVSATLRKGSVPDLAVRHALRTGRATAPEPVLAEFLDVLHWPARRS